MARTGDAADVDAEPPRDLRGRAAGRPPRRIALDGAGKVEEDEPPAASVDLLGHLRDERRDGLGASVQVAEQLTVRDAGEAFPGRPVRRPELIAFGEGALELRAHDLVHSSRVDAAAARRREAVLAEAEPQQEAGNRVERDEVPLVVIAVLEAVVVEGLGQDRLDLVAGDVGGECPYVGSRVGIRRAEIALVEIAERIPRRTGRIVAGTVGMQEDGPGVHGEVAGGRSPTRLPQHVTLQGQGADGRLHGPGGVERRLGREEHHPALLQDHPMGGVVREDVTGGVVGERRHHAAQAASPLEVVEHRVDALPGQVGGEHEGGCLQHARSTPFRRPQPPSRRGSVRARAAAAASR